ncbi:hypothetical protein [Streptomyces sp. NPDC055912]|uniref:hypothetical protein n=1 Tax=unclassified Streptomyces TaxID=2593676 RepID=UPI0035DB26C1
MANVVGVTATELRDAGREDAAAELEELATPEPSRPAGNYAPPLDAVTAIMAALTPEEQEEVIRRLRLTGRTTNPKGVGIERQHRQTG